MKWEDKDGFLDKLKDEKKYGIFLDMGVGKTSLLLALIEHKIFNTDIKKILIVAPKKVSMNTWQNEINKWTNLRFLRDCVTLLDGTEDERNEKLKLTSKQEFSVHIISSSLFEWLHYKVKKVGKYNKKFYNELRPQYDMIIIDECSQFKSTQTNRFKALKSAGYESIFLLSGTPFSNITKKYDKQLKQYYYAKTDELYYALNLLGLFKGTLTEYRNQFCYTTHWDTYTQRSSKETYEMLIEMLATKSIRKQLEKTVAVTLHKVYCETDVKIMREMVKDYIFETGGLMDITASNKAIMISKSLQISNGFIYGGCGTVIRKNEYKYERLKEIIATKRDGIVLFYNFKEDREFLLKKLGDDAREFKGEQDRLDFIANKIKVLIMSPFADKYGLNLQEGDAKTIVWFGLVWSAETYEQSNARLIRRGQKHDIDIYILLAKEGFDEYVYDTIVSKVETIDLFKSYIEANK